MKCRAIVSLAIGLALSAIVNCRAEEVGEVREFPLAWPGHMMGSTHEITFDPQGGNEFWVTGMHHDHVARVTLEGKAEFFPMPKGSHPHGIQFDADRQLWVSLEYLGVVAALDKHGKIIKQIDVRLHPSGAQKPINTHPHGLGLDADGMTIWFTGKKTNTIGKINPDGSVEHFELSKVGAVPIYLAPGPDGNMWCTELVGNSIARISPLGEVAEFTIPTANSRPIAIVAGPDKKSMWFSQEAGNKLGRIGLDGKITEYAVPLSQKNVILGGVACDSQGNLWTHSYVDPNNPLPAGFDYIIKIDNAIHTAPDGDLSKIPITYYKAISRKTIMHRILQGPDNNIWFTEMGVDKLGKLTVR
ncbi:MAG: hypothetical protein AB7O62_05210 [Pirellulales bacterium]